MVRELLGRVGRVIGHPSGAFAEVRQERLAQSGRYLLFLLLPATLVLVVGGLAARPMFIAPYAGEHQILGWLAVAMIVPTVIGMGVITVALGGLLLHPFVLLLGGRQGLAQTLKVAIYAGTPALLTLWFPPLLLFTAIWALVLGAIGLRQLHGISPVRAALAIALPLILLGELGLLLGR